MTEEHSLWNADLHLHTNLSFCAPRETQITDYLALCESEELTAIGISNHIYMPYVLEKHGFPEKRGYEYALRAAEEIRALNKTSKVKIYLGAEIETYRGFEPSLIPSEAGAFDYVLLAASHIMNTNGIYAPDDVSSPDKIRDIMLERYFYACSLDYPVPTAICHPLYPIVSGCEEEIVNGISDSTLADCFSLAAKKNIGIEIHACLYRSGTTLNEEGLSPTYLRVLAAAKACGCKFHFGCDAHRTGTFEGKHRLLRRAAELTGITPQDMWTL